METSRFQAALLAAALLAVSTLPSSAQDAMPGHEMSAMAADEALAPPLPEICRSGGEMPGDMSMSMEHPADAAHTDLMAGMDQTNGQMMTGAMVEDIDIAFVCAMIPHHQGAINMARAELEHGDDQWARDMAEMIIQSQEQEIADMISWLEEQAP